MARQTLSSLRGRADEAASHGRRTWNWRTSNSPATTEAGTAIVKLRDRSREMVRNNSWANKAIAVIGNNPIGTGIRPAISTESNNKKAEKKIKAAWNMWADSTACDFDGRLNFYGLQKLIIRAVAECGECLIVKDIDAKTQSVQLRILEGDFIDTNKHTAGTYWGESDFDFYGVRFDKKGKRIGVWLFERHPEFGNINSTLYKEDQVIHVFDSLRAGQARGVPMGVSGFLRLRDMSDYEDAQLVRQKVAACFSVFVQQNGAQVLNTVDDGDRFERVEPGMINYLSPGEQVTFGSPPVVEGYESYTRQVLRGIAAAYGVTYEALTGDYSQVNFSSARMAWLEFSRNIAGWQRDIMQPALEKVFTWFLDIFKLKTNSKEQYYAEWTAPRREMIDPTRETNALVAMIRAGLKSYPEAMRELGYDPEDTLDEAKNFYELIDKLGLKLTTDLRAQLQPDNTIAEA